MLLLADRFGLSLLHSRLLPMPVDVLAVVFRGQFVNMAQRTGPEEAGKFCTLGSDPHSLDGFP